MPGSKEDPVITATQQPAEAVSRSQYQTARLSNHRRNSTQFMDQLAAVDRLTPADA